MAGGRGCVRFAAEVNVFEQLIGGEEQVFFSAARAQYGAIVTDADDYFGILWDRNPRTDLVEQGFFARGHVQILACLGLTAPALFEKMRTL